MKADKNLTATLKKGMLLVIKAAPFFDKPYLYEITSAGEKQIRVSLYHSPTVKRSWSCEQMDILFAEGIVKIATDSDIQQLTR